MLDFHIFNETNKNDYTMKGYNQFMMLKAAYLRKIFNRLFYLVYNILQTDQIHFKLNKYLVMN